MTVAHLDCRRGVSLKEFASFKIGGKAKQFFVAHSVDDLGLIIKRIVPLYKYFYLLGGGSNLLITDKILSNPVLRLGEEFSYIRGLDENYLEIGAATPLSKIINYMVKNNLSCLENFVGIPARLGGLVVMNASSFGSQISQSLDEVYFMDGEGNVKVFKRDTIDFGYRSSPLKEGIVLKARLKVKRDDRIKESLIFYLKKRLASQDFSFPSAGCVFKNVQSFSAASLIEKCGLKGLTVGGASISKKHANFIINRCDAKAKDVVYIIEFIKDKVYNRLGILLEEEIVRWGI